MASNPAGEQETPAPQYPDQENTQPGGQGGLEHQHGDDERSNLQDGAGGRHEPLTARQQEQLDWLSRFAIPGSAWNGAASAPNPPRRIGSIGVRWMGWSEKTRSCRCWGVARVRRFTQKV